MQSYPNNFDLRQNYYSEVDRTHPTYSNQSLNCGLCYPDDCDRITDKQPDANQNGLVCNNLYSVQQRDAAALGFGFGPNSRDFGNSRDPYQNQYDRCRDDGEVQRSFNDYSSVYSRHNSLQTSPGCGDHDLPLEYPRPNSKDDQMANPVGSHPESNCHVQEVILTQSHVNDYLHLTASRLCWEYVKPYSDFTEVDDILLCLAVFASKLSQKHITLDSLTHINSIINIFESFLQNKLYANEELDLVNWFLFRDPILSLIKEVKHAPQNVLALSDVKSESPEDCPSGKAILGGESPQEQALISEPLMTNSPSLESHLTQLESISLSSNPEESSVGNKKPDVSLTVGSLGDNEVCVSPSLVEQVCSLDDDCSCSDKRDEVVSSVKEGNTLSSQKVTFVMTGDPSGSSRATPHLPSTKPFAESINTQTEMPNTRSLPVGPQNLISDNFCLGCGQMGQFKKDCQEYLPEEVGPSLPVHNIALSDNIHVCTSESVNNTVVEISNVVVSSVHVEDVEHGHCVLVPLSGDIAPSHVSTLDFLTPREEIEHGQNDLVLLPGESTPPHMSILDFLVSVPPGLDGAYDRMLDDSHPFCFCIWLLPPWPPPQYGY